MSSSPWTPLAPEDGPSGPPGRRRRLLTVALVLFAVGVVATVAAAVLPFLLEHDGPTVVYLTAVICTPAGFLLALVSLFLEGRVTSPRRDTKL